VRPIEHPFEPRALRNDEAIVHNWQHVRGLYVVLMQLVGPRGPWDYVVKTYFADGTRVPGGSWQGPGRERADAVLEGVVDSWRDDSRIPNAAAMLSRHERRAAS
jgi:hypothetical protein